MIVLGIDPGFAALGWCVIRFSDGVPVECLDLGAIKTKKTTQKIPLYDDNAQRAQHIYLEITSVMRKYDPTVVSVEAESWTRMPSDKLLGIARGAIYAATTEYKCFMRQVRPQAVKEQLCGSAKASKAAVEKAVAEQVPGFLERLNDLKKGERNHVSDAAGCAIVIKYDPVFKLAQSIRDSPRDPG